MSQRVVVIGDALIDELRDDDGVREFVGGAALNVAVGLSRLGRPATLIAMVGDDEPGARIRDYLEHHGVELVATPSPLGSSRAVSTRSSGGEPQYVFNEAAQRRRIHFGDAERAAIAGAAMVVVSCFPFDDTAQTEELQNAVAAASVPLAIDPNPREGMLHDRAAFVAGFESLVPHAVLVKAGEDDATLLYDDSLDSLRTRLLDLGADAVLATYGSRGAAIDADGDAVTRPISEMPGAIVDTMGAGDAVLSTAVSLLLNVRPENPGGWDAVLARAMDVAAATCRFEGALLRLPEALRDDEARRPGA